MRDNFNFNKRKREEAKKKKRAEKIAKRLHQKSATPPAPESTGADLTGGSPADQPI